MSAPIVEITFSPVIQRVVHIRRSGERFYLCGGYAAGRALLGEKLVPTAPVCAPCAKVNNDALPSRPGTGS